MQLDVFVEADCRFCGTSQAIADDLARRYPQLVVRVVDVAEAGAEVPESLVAVPTYMLDGRVVSLGNPLVDDLAALIEAASRVDHT